VGLDVTELERLKAGLSENERLQLEMEIRSQRKDTGTLAALACLGFIGIAGIHRFMMGKIGTGLLWFFTGGICLIGTIIDLVNMRRMVAEHNYEVEYQVIQDFLARKRAREAAS
jgi:TM2 domain-containing membrane protein YozV